MDATIENLYDQKIIDLHMVEKDKNQVIQHLAQLLYDAGYVDNITDYIDDIYVREQQGITGMGDNIAIPHGKSASVRKIGLAIGKTDHMIPWESYDQQPVNIIMLFAVPIGEDSNRIHLKLLSSVAEKLGNDDIVRKIKQATTNEELKDGLFSGF